VATARNEKGQAIARQRVRDYLVPVLGVKLVTRVTADDLREFRLWLEGREIAVQTVAHVLSDTRCFFRWTEDAGYIARSPVPRRLLPRIQERPPDRLTDGKSRRSSQCPNPGGS
jgi:site-specific recombinase XerD